MAQGLGEYGAVAAGRSGGGDVSSRLGDIVAAIEDAVRNPTPKHWVGLGIFLFLLWFFFIRRPR